MKIDKFEFSLVKSAFGTSVNRAFKTPIAGLRWDDLQQLHPGQAPPIISIYIEIKARPRVHCREE